MKVLVLVLGLAAAPSAWACMGSYDCEVGSKCMKESGEIEGVCVGSGYSRKQVEDRDKNPPSSYSNDKKGKSCMGNYDCGALGSCVKESGSVYGVCS